MDPLVLLYTLCKMAERNTAEHQTLNVRETKEMSAVRLGFMRIRSLFFFSRAPAKREAPQAELAGGRWSEGSATPLRKRESFMMSCETRWKS